MSHLCINCQSVRLVRTSKDIRISEGTSPETVPAVKGWHCPDCGLVMFFDEDRSNGNMDHGHSSSPALLKQAAFIRDVRKKLSLNLLQAQEIFGGKEGSFSKYEQMEAIPPKAIVHLLRILDNHPELLAELCTNK